MQFPTWMYHAEHGARLFKTAEQYKAAGAGWFDHPDKTKTQEAPAKVKRPRRG